MRKISKKSFQRIQSYDAQFLGPKWPISFMALSFTPIYMPKIKVRYKYISEILTIKEYWNLIGWEPFLAITWESDFSKACSFLKMLMNHKIFHSTKIPYKINDVIFLKSPKILFWGHFRPFLAAGDSFQKIWLCHIQLYMSSYQHAKFQKKLMSQFQENLRTDRRTDRKTVTHYFIGHFHPRPGVQKMYPRLKNAAQLALTFRISLTFIEHVNSASIIQIMNSWCPIFYNLGKEEP